jgi:hypothetical protein
MWGWNCCGCVQSSLTLGECVVCCVAPKTPLFIPRCRVASSSSALSRCLVLLIPHKRFVLKETVLHIGLVDSRGKVVDLHHKQGVRNKTWNKRKSFLLEIPLRSTAANWDELLEQHVELEAKTVFDKRTNNCLDFVVRMLNRGYFSVPLSRHHVSGLLLADWIGRWQNEQSMQLKLERPSDVWVTFRPTTRKQIASCTDCFCDWCEGTENGKYLSIIHTLCLKNNRIIRFAAAWTAEGRCARCACLCTCVYRENAEELENLSVS